MQAHLASGQRARLVAAQNLHAAEVLDGGKVLHDHLATGHAHGAPGQRDRGDHGEELRREPDRQRHREQEGLQRRAMEGHVDDHHEQHQEGHRSHDEHRELSGAPLELRFGRRGRETCSNVPEGGLPPRGHHHGLSRPADHGRSEKDEVAGLGDLRGRRSEVGRLLFRRHRLAGQRRLLHVKIARLEQPRVGGHPVAGPQPHDVAGDEDAAGELGPRAVSPDGGRGCRLLTQPFRRPLRAVGLHEIENQAEDDHDGDDRGIDDVAEDRGHGAGHDQDEDERVREEAKQLPRHGPATPSRRLVRPHASEAAARLVVAQARLGSLQSGQECIPRQRDGRHQHRALG